MNKDRRIKLKEAKGMLVDVNKIINEVLQEEEIAFDNLTEGLQQTRRGEQMEENVDMLQEIIDKLEEVIDDMDDIY